MRKEHIGMCPEEGDETQFVARVRTLLDTSLGQIPQGAQSQLSSARLAAVASVKSTDSVSADLALNGVKQLGEQVLPSEVQSSLDDIRSRALSLARRQQNSDTLRRRWANSLFNLRRGSVAAFASICILVTGVILVDTRESSDTVPLAIMEEAWVLASEEELELYENLEFYQWLADNGLDN